jgi:hypothetical protein
LPPPPPLGTARTTFTVSGSSIPKAQGGPGLAPQDLHGKDAAPHLLPEGASASLAFVDRRGAGRCPSDHRAVIQHSLTKGLTARSRDGTPDGSLPACAWDDVVWLSRRNPYPVHYRQAFACSIFLCPQPHRLALRLAVPKGGLRGCHVPREYPGWVRSHLSAGGASSAAGDR